MLRINLSGSQELHPTSHLETVANQIFYRQRSFPQVLHWRERRRGWGQSRREKKSAVWDEEFNHIKWLTFLYSGSLTGRIGWWTLRSGERGGGWRGRLTSPLGNLTRFNHPPHLALGFWRAILSGEAFQWIISKINIGLKTYRTWQITEFVNRNYIKGTKQR